jgi:hypothetical protein
MKCRICKTNEAITTNCLCDDCIGKPEPIEVLQNWGKDRDEEPIINKPCKNCGVPYMYENKKCKNHTPYPKRDMKKEIKEKIIEDWNDFVVKELCPARCGHLRFKIRDFWLQKLEAEKQKWAEDLLKKMPKVDENCLNGDYKNGFNQCLKELKTIIENVK